MHNLAARSPSGHFRRLKRTLVYRVLISTLEGLVNLLKQTNQPFTHGDFIAPRVIGKVVLPQQDIAQLFISRIFGKQGLKILGNATGQLGSGPHQKASNIGAGSMVQTPILMEVRSDEVVKS